MRGISMVGPSRLTALDIDAANRLFGWKIQPHEVEALVALDVVTLHPGEEDKED